MILLRAVRFAVAHRALVLVTTATLLGLASLGIARLELRTDGRTLLDPRAPEVAVDRAIRARHGVSDPIVVLLEHAGSVLETACLLRQRALSERIAKVAGVHAVHSLHALTTLDFEGGRLQARPILDPGHDETAAARAERLATLPFTERWLVTRDQRGACLHVDLDADADRPQVCRAVATVATAEFPDAAVAGAPMVEALLGDAVVRDLAGTVPLALLANALVLWLAFRSVAGVLVPMLAVGAAMLFTLGGAGFAGVPVTLASTVLPVVLLTACLGDVVHVVHRVATLHAEQPDRPPAELVVAALDSLHRAIVCTALTTTAGFLSFVLSPLPALQAFGIPAAAGTIVAMLATFVVAPALLVTFPLPRVAPAEVARAPRVRARGARHAALLIAAAGSVLALALTATIRVQDRWIDNFATDSALRVAHQRLTDSYLPAHRLLFAIQLDDLLDPRGLAQLASFTARIATCSEVAATRSLIDLIGVAQDLRRSDTHTLPASLGALREDLLWLAAADPARLRAFLDRDQRSLLVHVFLRDADDARARAVIAQAHAAADAMGLRFELAGDAALSEVLVRGIVAGQVLSLLGALAAVLLIGAVLFRSLVLGIVLTVPVTLAALGVFGSLGVLGIPLGVATSMFGSLAIGVGVDAAIHWLERWRRERRRPGTTDADAVARTRAAVEPAIARNAAVLIAGCAVLLLSSVPPNRRLGGLLALALLLAWLATKYVLPALVEGLRGSAEDARVGPRYPSAST